MELITAIFSGPVLPATLFLGILLIWSLLALLGAIDFDVTGTGADIGGDVGGADFSASADGVSQLGGAGTGGVTTGSAAGGAGLEPSAAAGTASIGLVASRWLNLNSVPLAIWTACFGVLWWFTSAMLWVIVDQYFFSPLGWLWSSVLVFRNVLVAATATKLLTNPIRPWFVQERITATSLIGRECSISSSEATPSFGLVKLPTDGSPLLLNVRTDGEHLVQGTRVWITHYDAKRRVYIVSPTGTLARNPNTELPS